MKTRTIFVRTAAALTALICLMSLAAPAAVADPGDEFKKLPGFVDFDALGIFDKIEPKVEVNLKGPLLRVASNAVSNDDPDLAGMLNNIQLVRVNVFSLTSESRAGVARKASEVAKQLEKKGWEMPVRVNDEDEIVYVYMLPGKNDMIDGLVVMVLGNDDEATFVNIVGTIDPAQIGKVSRAFDIDSLNGPIEINAKIHTDKKDAKRDGK